MTDRHSCWIKILSEPHFSQTRGGHTLPHTLTQPLQCIHTSSTHTHEDINTPPPSWCTWSSSEVEWGCGCVYFWGGRWLGRFGRKSVCTVCVVPLSAEAEATFLFEDLAENGRCGGICGWRERPRPPDYQKDKAW